MRMLPPLLFAVVLACSPPAARAQDAPSVAPVDAEATKLLAQYRAQQLQRLAALGDRDSLIAAALLGIGDAGEGVPPGYDEVLRKLYAEHGEDVLSLYALSLACQETPAPCAAPDAPATLVRVAPDNAVHWLVQANGAEVDRARLHSAAQASIADSHHSALLGIVRTALADQPAPTGADENTDAQSLAQALRLRVAASLPYPAYGAAMNACSAQAAAHAALASAGEDGESLRNDCASLGHALFADQGQQVVTRMYGGTLLRRFSPNTRLASEALAFRLQYLWLDQLRIGGNAAAREQLDADVVAQGEWEALQRQAERSGSTRNPPPDWQPRDPSALLLPELR